MSNGADNDVLLTIEVKDKPAEGAPVEDSRQPGPPPVRTKITPTVQGGQAPGGPPGAFPLSPGAQQGGVSSMLSGMAQYTAANASRFAPPHLTGLMGAAGAGAATLGITAAAVGAPIGAMWAGSRAFQGLAQTGGTFSGLTRIPFLGGIEQSMEDMARRAEQYSPMVAGARARQDIATMGMDIRRASVLGPDLARFVASQTQLSRSVEEIKLALLREILPEITRAAGAAASGASWLADFAKVMEAGGFIDNLKDWLEKMAAIGAITMMPGISALFLFLKDDLVKWMEEIRETARVLRETELQEATMGEEALDRWLTEGGGGRRYEDWLFRNPDWWRSRAMGE